MLHGYVGIAGRHPQALVPEQPGDRNEIDPPHNQVRGEAVTVVKMEVRDPGLPDGALERSEIQVGKPERLSKNADQLWLSNCTNSFWSLGSLSNSIAEGSIIALVSVKLKASSHFQSRH